jgi:hypothetical protein
VTETNTPAKPVRPLWDISATKPPAISSVVDAYNKVTNSFDNFVGMPELYARLYQHMKLREAKEVRDE